MTHSKKTYLTALAKSIEHWEDNCVIVAEGKLVLADIRSDKCELCQAFRCAICPLGVIDENCDYCDSPWYLVSWSINNNHNPEIHCYDMLHLLMLLREAVRTDCLFEEVEK